MCRSVCYLFAVLLLGSAQVCADAIYARDPAQPIDAAYTDKITAYTTDKSFNSPLTDYLPASTTVPAPTKVLGDIAGAPNYLPYTKDVYRYFDLLAQSTPRVKVFRIGKSEEGRDMIAVAVADESLLADLKANDARLAQLADPRTIGMDDAKAEALVAQTTPVYYITGTIHSVETGAPTALMELAYRLAVDDAPYIRKIRSHVITLITPIVEVDGRDRMVDLYNWHRAHLDQIRPPLMYWGHYVAHDNNRDAMALTLNLTRNVLDTYLGWHAQVLHDLHESYPFLYDNTVGDGPYNAWVDPILVEEWQMLGWDNVRELTMFGMPGVYTHGDFDTWSPGYLMFLAAAHNGISRLYETFGNGGADTLERILTPDEYARTWYKPNPPLPRVQWSQRDNNNYEQTGLLTALNYFADHRALFLHNFWLKSKRSIEKPALNGPAAYVFPADDPHHDAQSELLRILQLQHVEVSRTGEAFTALVPVPPAKHSDTDSAKESSKSSTPRSLPRTFAPGSFVVRLDQPYSRIADMLLDRQYWSPEDPQRHPFDDTGWSFGPLFGTEVVRVTDASILRAPMQTLREPVRASGGMHGSGGVYVIDNHADPALIALRYALKDADIFVADAAFDAADHHFGIGSWLVRKVDNAKLSKKLADLGLEAWAVGAMPEIPTHHIGVPRIALMHTWLSTQAEGWWRIALDKLGVPYRYISTQSVARMSDLRRDFDVILFAPVAVNDTRAIVEGTPMYGKPVPWKKTKLTPNMDIDETDDIRPGLGAAGIEHLQRFLDQGGLLIAASEAAKFAVDFGLAPGVSIAPAKDLKVVGSVLNAEVVDAATPVAYGYARSFAVYSPDGMAFKLSNQVGGDGNLPNAKDYKRPTGRGGPHDSDAPEGRPIAEALELPNPKPWEALPLNAEQLRNNRYAIPPDQQPHTIVRFADEDSLLVSGLLQGGGAIAEHAAVVEAHYGRGHAVLFGINPIWRGETIGSYGLVFNAILNYDRL